MPDILLGNPVQGEIMDIQAVSGTLWSAARDSTAVHGFLNAATIVSGKTPDIVLSGVDMDKPSSLAVCEHP